MTVTFSSQTYDDLWQETANIMQFDPADPFDRAWNCPKPIGQGYERQIQLRQGLWLSIAAAQLHDRLIVLNPDCPDCLRYHFHIYGQHEDKYTTVGDREFALYGGGLTPAQAMDAPQQQYLEVTIELEPETLRSFVGDATGQLPAALQHLVRPVEQECYTRVAAVTPAMESVLWQIVRCPFYGLPKRMFLEGKVLELVSLVLELEQEIWAETRPLKLLKAGTVERIHYAKTLLLRNLHQPPSLVELAQQVKLNECTLKRGFRQEFGTTVFGYLHEYRLEQAHQLLISGHMKVAEVMAAVGFADRRYFASVFRKKFGMAPRDVLRQHKSSV